MAAVWIALSVGGALVLVWGALVAALVVTLRRHGRSVEPMEAVRLLPDVLGLLRRLLLDRSLPWQLRLEIGALWVYLAMPLDLIPDFIPVIGFADDALVAVLVLRSVARHTGSDTLDSHWPGSGAGLDAVKKLCGIGTSGT